MRTLCPTIRDRFYPPAPILRERDAVRAVLLDGQDRIALLHIRGRDDFGDRDHFELPGGGVEPGESFEEALRREVEEELGIFPHILAEVGIIANEYNLLRRRDVQHFYLARAAGTCPAAPTAEERRLFGEVLWVPAGEVLALYDSRPVENVGIEIHRRDRIALAAALDIGRQLGAL